MISLTPRQADLLRFIAGFIEANGCAPTYLEMAEGIGASSVGSIHKVIQRLRDRGAIEAPRQQARGVRILAPVPIPRAPAGEPLFFVRVRRAQP